MVGFAAATGLAPCRPLRAGLSRTRALGVDAYAVKPGSEQVAQQRFGLVPVLRRNQFAESQRAAGHTAIQSPLESGIHLDNHSLRVAAGHGNGSVFKNGTKSRSGVFCRGKFWPRKWGCGIHTVTVARDHSRKKDRDGSPIPWCSRNGNHEGKAAFALLVRPHYRSVNLTLRRAHVTQIGKGLWKTLDVA